MPNSPTKHLTYDQLINFLVTPNPHEELMLDGEELMLDGEELMPIDGDFDYASSDGDEDEDEVLQNFTSPRVSYKFSNDNSEELFIRWN